MARNSEFNSYTFIKNDLQKLGWNTRSPARTPEGQVYTQQECLDHAEIKTFLGLQKPEFVVKVLEGSFWVLEAKGEIKLLDLAFGEAHAYALQINQSRHVKATLISGIAGNDVDGYLIRSAIVRPDGTTEEITYNDKAITGLLSPEQSRYLIREGTHRLNELVTDEAVLLFTAEEVNAALHEASINKDSRARVMSSILLAMISDALPNFNSSPSLVVKEINNRAEDVLISHGKGEFAPEIILTLPKEVAAQEKFKRALVRVFFLLRKINVKAAMNGGQDLLGKFYEVFLKYGNGAKDIGIVLTPRHITRFACNVLGITGEDLVYDCACGTGGFLVAAYDNVRISDPSKLEEFRKFKIFGVEQQANVATLAIVNMIFRGDGKSSIINNNCFAKNLERKVIDGVPSAEFIGEASTRPAVTRSLLNPPFALKAGDEKESSFIQHSLDQMAEGGLLFAVLPSSVMYSAGDNFNWRKRMLTGNTLVAVVGFPNDLFYPQATVEPITIILRKGIPHAEGRAVAWVRVTDDGFVKRKKKRLPTGDSSMIDTAEEKLVEFVQREKQVSVPHLIEFYPIRENDKKLELIPENYLSSPVISDAHITRAMEKVFAEMIFEKIRSEL